MARARSKKTGRYIKKSAAPRKRRRVIRLRKHGVAMINPRRRRRGAPRKKIFARVRRGTRALVMNPRRRSRSSYRSNPGFASFFSTPMLKTVALTAGGFIAVPMVEGFIAKFVPVSMQSKVTSYAVKIASVLGLYWAVGKFVGKDAGQKVAIGGAAYVALGAIKDFFPTLLPTTTPPGTGTYIGAQPLLGTYQRGYMGSPITSTAPSRLQPQSRY